MNELETNPPTYGAQLDGLVRENPTQAILWAVGAGVAIACLVRALQPRPAEHRAARLLEDLREQLSSLALPAYREGRGLANNGANFVKDGTAQLANLRFDRTLGSPAAKLRKLFR